MAGNVTLFTFIRGCWLRVGSCSHDYIRWGGRKMFNLFDTCLHYLEARVYHSIKKTDLRTEAIHLKSLPHRSYSTNKAPAPWFKILLDKTNLDKKPAHTNYVFFMFRNHEHFLKLISCLGPGLGFEQNMTAGRSLFLSIFSDF